MQVSVQQTFMLLDSICFGDTLCQNDDFLTIPLQTIIKKNDYLVRVLLNQTMSKFLISCGSYQCQKYGHFAIHM